MVQRQKRYDRVVVIHAVREAIATGELKAGIAVDAERLATEHEVTPDTVAEALAALEQEGLVEGTPSGSYHVHAISDDEIGEYFRLRRLIEATVAEELAGRAKGQDIAALLDEIQRQAAAVQDEDRSDFLMHAWEFHCRMAEHAGFRLAAQIMRLWRDKFRRIGRGAVPDCASMREVIAEHTDIVTHVSSHDRTKAKDSLLHHLDRTVARLGRATVLPNA